MSTNNISEKQIFSYLISTFNYWGIKSATQQTLKQAKKNFQSAVKDMKLTLFYLILLHIFDYKIKINDYLGSDIREGQIDEVIMAYLAECECPLLLEMRDHKKSSTESQSQQVEYFVGCNLESSRNLLILCGWVMGVSDYFNQILSNAIQSRLNKIQNPPISLKAVQSLIQKKMNFLVKESAQSEAQSIASLYKCIKAHLYQTECYMQKRTKTKARIEQTLQKLLNTSIPIQSLLIGVSSQRDGRGQVQLQEIIQNQIQNMKERKYFWIWLEEKILKDTQAQIKKNHELYENCQQDQTKITYHCQVDLQYLSKYIELCDYYQDKYKELTTRLNHMTLPNKKYKEIQTQVNCQFKQTLNRNSNSLNKKHLFIALQLRSHLNINLQKPNQPKTKNHQSEQMPIKNAHQMNKKHKKQIKKYLQSIQDAIKFI